VVKHPKKKIIYEARRASGLCTRCGQPSNGQSLCDLHRDSCVCRYATRKAARTCTKCGAVVPNGRSLCIAHSEVSRKRQRQTKVAQRNAGLCRYGSCRQPLHEGDKTYCALHAVEVRRRTREEQRRLKREVLTHYGGCRCACCGESEIQFLSIDHIHGGGTQHRKQIGRRSMYAWLKKQGYPDGFQVLCMNCNFAKGSFGQCPHERERGLAA